MSHVEGGERLRTDNRIGLQALLALELPDCLLQYLIVAQWLRLNRVISQQRSVQWAGRGLGVEQPAQLHVLHQNPQPRIPIIAGLEQGAVREGRSEERRVGKDGGG